MGHVVRVKTAKKAKNGRPVLRYRAAWREPDGTQRAQTFGSERAALDHLAVVESTKLTGRYVDPAGARLPLAEYVAHFMAVRQLKPTTREQWDAHLRVNVLPYLGQLRLGAIRRSDVQQWIVRLGGPDRLPVTGAHGAVRVPKPLAPGTIRLVYNLLRCVLREAVRDRLIAESPCDRIGLPDIPRRELRYLTPGQVWELADTIAPRYRALILTGAGTGLRPGELFGLRLGRVDFLRKRLEVVEQVQWVRGAEPFYCPPKTRAGRRTVPLPDFVVEALAKHLQQYPTEDAIFTRPDGRLIQRNRFNESVWRQAHRAVGLPPSVTPHSLRHTYAAGLIAEGLHPKVIQERLGHASITETMDTYGHLFPSAEEETSAALDRIFGLQVVPVRKTSDLETVVSG